MTTLALKEERRPSLDDLEMSSAPDCLQREQIVLLNGAAAATNLGCQYSSEGEPRSAMELFREALVAVKMAFADDLSPSNISQAILDQAAHRVQQARTCLRLDDPFLVLREDTRRSCNARDKAAMDEECSSDYVFCHPLPIPAPISMEGVPSSHYFFCNDSEVDSTIFSAAIIYNMAVTTHKMIHLQPPGQKREALRQRTSTLYGMCNQLLANAAEQVDGSNRRIQGSPSPIIQIRGIGKALHDLMTMANVNNQASLLLDTIDHQLSLVHMDRLVAVAAAVRSQRYGSEILDTAVASAVDFFLSNATKSRLCTTSAAAAA